MAEGHPFFAFFYPMFMPLYERKGLADQRRRLLKRAHGHVLEIGAGTGLNFDKYPAGIEVLATEPDPHMLKRARKAASRAGGAVTVEQAHAEALPAEDGSVDTIVSTLVLCSVPDVTAALKEIDRILKPGGQILLLEHVRAAEEGMAKKQDRGERMQVRFGAGCHPNRDTRSALVAAGFEVGSVADVVLPLPKLVTPGIMGAAVKH